MTTLDQEYSPSSLVEDVPALLRAYASRSARARARLRMRTLRYGPETSMALDFFPAARRTHRCSPTCTVATGRR